MDFKDYNVIFNEKNYPDFKKIIYLNGQINLDKEIYVPKDESPCVCLSGKKYKDCCKKEIKKALELRNSKDIEELRKLYFTKESKLVSCRVVKKSIEKKNISYCSAQKVFDDCDNENRNTRSHTMSRGNVLKNLAGDGKDIVIGFNDHKVMNINYNLDDYKEHIEECYSDVSINDASVTVSFCKKHDEELFADIEKQGHTQYKNTDIENLEYALKAVSFDVYYKVMNIRYMAQLLRKNKSIVYDNNGEYSRYFRDYYYDKKTLFEIYPLMINIISEIKDLKEREREPKLKTVCFELPVKKINFSCSEVIYEWGTYCFINVINSPKPYIIISYYEQDGLNRDIEELKKNIKNLSKNNIIEFLWPIVNMLLCNAQNIYFNKKAFKKLSADEKVYLYVVHREGSSEIPDEIQGKYNKKLKQVLFQL